MLAGALPFLACPLCAGSLELSNRALRCASGHSFDVARQGYVSFLSGRPAPSGDSAGMVSARSRFLSAGHFDPLVEAVAATASGRISGNGGCVVEVGAGNAHYLSATLEGLPDRIGLALDSARPALRAAARAHPRIAALGCDAWGRLPVRDEAAAVLLDVFAPRHGAEFRRVLRPGGTAVVVTPTPRHLHELVETLHLVRVQEHKADRLAEHLEPHLAREIAVEIDRTMALAHTDVRALVAMGPSARHVNANALDRRVAELPEPMTVTASVTVSTYRRAG